MFRTKIIFHPHEKCYFFLYNALHNSATSTTVYSLSYAFLTTLQSMSLSLLVSIKHIKQLMNFMIDGRF